LFDQYRRFYGRQGDPEAARQFLRARLEHGDAVLLLAERQGEPVAFTQLYQSYSSLALARMFVLNDLYVLEQARRQGVAAALLAAAADHGRRLGAVSLTLSTAHTNAAAQALYAAAGWVRDDEFLVYNLALDR
jgi:ribosomal protein S18 acetylase RimI-like enzyme